MSDVARRSPTGAQHEIVREPQRAIVTEVGATLRHYSVDGVDVIDGFDSVEQSPAGRGQVLAPWPNRLDSGTYAFEGVTARAALDEPERNNAIHGLVRWLSWREVSRSEESIELGCALAPQPGYPWHLDLGIEYRLTANGLTVTMRAENASASPAPFGIGFHPYLSIGRQVDEALVTIPATRRLVTDERGLPTGQESVAGTPFDYAERRSLGSIHLDTGYTALLRGEDGLARARVASPDDARELTLWVDDRFPYLMVFTGDTLEPMSRRRLGIAIEPMTCPPNAFVTGTDVHRLVVGQPWQARWGIDVDEREGGSRT